MKQPLLAITIFLIMILTMTAASAITASTCSYKISVKYYSVPSVIDRSVCLKNQNAIPVTVTLSATGSIAPLVKFKENNVVLAPGETRFVPFNVTVPQQLTYTGIIKSTFSVPPGQDNFPVNYANSEVTVSKGTECSAGQIKNCTVDTCAGRNLCTDGAWGSCEKNDPSCGICTESWVCTAWTDCLGGSQSRTCTDQNGCNTTLNKPLVVQTCSLCSVGADCPAMDCDHQDGCYDNRSRDCSDIPGDCTGGVCVQNFCPSPQTCVRSGTDADGDGYDKECGDCRDTNPDVHPGGIEICNNIDDDCDGDVDEWLYRECNLTHIGECGEGIEQCEAGYWMGCPAPKPETCDNKDNDCDMQVDESVSESCGITEVGECTMGREACVSGAFSGCSAVFPADEVPENGLDEDCNGADLDLCMIYSPIDSIYSAKKLPLTVQCLRQVEDLRFSTDGARFSRLCANCQGYTKNNYFIEGNNSLQIQARYRNITYTYSTDFFIDSQLPRIAGVSPSKGFANGMFSVEYTELNLKNTTLLYWKAGGPNRSASRIDCPSGSGKSCPFNVDISGFDGQEIEYMFLLEDIAGNNEDSQKYKLRVDITRPLLTILTPFRSIYSGDVLIDVQASEMGEISYVDSSDTNPSKRILCSSCTSSRRTISFREGLHQLSIRTTDAAGNFDEKNVSFVVDETRPDIKGAEPDTGYTNGNFVVRYTELNPVNMTLFYRRSGDPSFKSISKASCIGGKDMYCDFSINVTPYDGGEIDYYLNLTDITGASDTTKPVKLKVDMTAPVLILGSKFDKVYANTKVLFNFSSSETANIMFIDSFDSKPVERSLCTKCKSYSRATYLDNGEHNLTVIARDEAGNEDREYARFYVDSQPPAISVINPTSRYATGNFDIEYTEENCQELVFTIGNASKSRRFSLPCESGKKVRASCGSTSLSKATSFNITEFEGSVISYNFTLRDIANNTKTKGASGLIVDTTAPKFKTVKTLATGKNLYLNITMDEVVKSLKYFDSSSNGQEITLCTNCKSYGTDTEQRKYFAPGLHNVTLVCEDEAGNRRYAPSIVFTSA